MTEEERYRKACALKARLREEGKSEEEIEIEIDGFYETNWTDAEWSEYTGGESDDW
ncbi:MAG: hypothetical protein MJ185_02755 [Treponema sp.]|nr:hypothetical protein [Treponema sp.]